MTPPPFTVSDILYPQAPLRSSPYNLVTPPPKTVLHPSLVLAHLKWRDMTTKAQKPIKAGSVGYTASNNGGTSPSQPVLLEPASSNCCGNTINFLQLFDSSFGLGPPGCKQVAHVLDIHRVKIFVVVHMVEFFLVAHRVGILLHAHRVEIFVVVYKVEIMLVAHSIVDKLVKYAHEQFREWLQKFWFIGHQKVPGFSVTAPT